MHRSVRRLCPGLKMTAGSECSAVQLSTVHFTPGEGIQILPTPRKWLLTSVAMADWLLLPGLVAGGDSNSTE